MRNINEDNPNYYAELYLNAKIYKEGTEIGQGISGGIKLSKGLRVVFRNPSNGRFVKHPGKEFSKIITTTADLRGDALFNKIAQEYLESHKGSMTAENLFDAIEAVLKARK